MYHELIVRSVSYVHATTILCSYCNIDSYEIIKHAADKIVTDGYSYMYMDMLAIHASSIPRLCFI